MTRRTIRGRHILITGGSAGIGLEMARLFAREGARLSLIARDPAKLEAACAGLRAGGAPEARAFPADVTDASALARALEEACHVLGPLDGLVANSGYCHPGFFEQMEPGDIIWQLRTNLEGAALTLRFALPYLLETKGFAAVTSSPAGNAAIFGFGAYGATKAGLNHLVRALRHEYRGRGVTLHLLLPPDTDTPGYQHEITLYPPETRAMLSGGKLFPPERVAAHFVEGIRRGKPRVAVGLETHALLRVVRYLPFIWEAYVRAAVRKARAQTGRKGGMT